MSRHPTILAVNAYKAAHPDVDFRGQMIRLDRDENGGYVAVGHEPTPPEVVAEFARCCCHPDQPRGHARNAQGSTKPSL